MEAFEQHATKITLVVIEENALGCMFPESDVANIISASVCKGSTHMDGDIVSIRVKGRLFRKVRIATVADFDDYRMARSNYIGREHEYHFQSEG